MSELAILTCICAAVALVAILVAKATPEPVKYRAFASPPGKLNSIDWLAAVKEAAYLAAGAALTFLVQWITQQDFGLYTPLVVAAATWLTGLLDKWRGGPV